MFWVWRIDLLTLPVFVAGAVAIIFGVRVLWRQKLAVGYLFLGWPYPYSSVLLRVLDAFTTATLCAHSRDRQGRPRGQVGDVARRHAVRRRPPRTVVPLASSRPARG